MNPANTPKKDRCACCKAPLPQGPSNRSYDRDFKGEIGKCCASDIASAEFALSRAGFQQCRPEREEGQP